LYCEFHNFGPCWVLFMATGGTRGELDRLGQGRRHWWPELEKKRVIELFAVSKNRKSYYNAVSMLKVLF
jgi:hypothetical protein